MDTSVQRQLAALNRDGLTVRDLSGDTKVLTVRDGVDDAGARFGGRE